MSASTQQIPQSGLALSRSGMQNYSQGALQSMPKALPQSPLAVRFGMRLRSLRQARGMTQIQVAVEFGIDRTFLSDLERGRKSVSLPFLEVFALGFGLSLSELLDQL